MLKRLTCDGMIAELKAHNRDYYSEEAYEYIYKYMESLDRNWELNVIKLCNRFEELEKDELEDYEGHYTTVELKNGKYLRIWH